MRRIMIAGTNSGVGKTTITAAVIAALTRRGHTVVPFKVGPDYIDPGFHALAAGMPAGNLDSWMVPPDQVLEILERRVPPDAIAVIEGVMGLYDGRRDEGETGSSAHIAKITQTPVILVASGAKMARSAAALVGGYIHFDPDVSFAGVVFNQVSGDSHYRLLSGAVQEHLQLPALGYFPKNTDIAIPERHLGLMAAAEAENVHKLMEQLAELAETQLDLDAILLAAEKAGSLPAADKRVFPKQRQPVRCRIAVAKDEAFHFYYPENLELLTVLGAELVYFSPLHDKHLPEGIQGILLGGGFPELFAENLSKNSDMREDIKNAVMSGMPVYAECGGYMYLSGSLTTFAGESFHMCGVFPGAAVMRSGRRALGYVEVAGTGHNFLLAEGQRCRGHEFHWSDMENTGQTAVYDVVSDSKTTGERQNNCIGSYIHLHFLSNPAIAQRFIDTCARYGKEGGSIGHAQ